MNAEDCKQVNGWSCYPATASWLTGIPYLDLVESIGHDGSQVVWEEKEEPWNRMAYSTHEIELGLLRHGWALISLPAMPMVDSKFEIPGYPDFESLQEEIQEYSDKIIVVVEKPNGLHCLAWVPSKGMIVDPLLGEEIGETDLPAKYFELLVEIKT